MVDGMDELMQLIKQQKAEYNNTNGSNQVALYIPDDSVGNEEEVRPDSWQDLPRSKTAESSQFWCSGSWSEWIGLMDLFVSLIKRISDTVITTLTFPTRWLQPFSKRHHLRHDVDWKILDIIWFLDIIIISVMVLVLITIMIIPIIITLIIVYYFDGFGWICDGFGKNFGFIFETIWDQTGAKFASKT